MNYEELVAKAREVFGKADASRIQGHVAYQFNITGEGEGAFYLEIDNGTIKIEPYEYFDRDVLFTMTAKNLIKIGLGELDPVWAFTTGRLKLEGSIEKALLLKDLAASVKEQMEREAAAGQQEAAASVSEENGEAKAEDPSSEENGEAKAEAEDASSGENGEAGADGTDAAVAEDADDDAADEEEESPSLTAGLRLPGSSGGRGNKNKRNRKKRR